MIEQSFAFGEGRALVGTTCLPDLNAGERAPLGIILFNAGIVHRIGPHRVNVRLARKLAQRGIPSLRFDLSGLGDSGRAPTTRPYNEQVVADLHAAMDCLGERGGVRQFALLGFCSGGWHAYNLAPMETRVAGIILYDAYHFPTARCTLNRHLIRGRKLGFGPARIRSLATRARSGVDRLRRLWQRNAGLVPGAEASLFPRPSKAEFARTLKALHDRGTHVSVMHSSDVEKYNYSGQFHDAFKSLGLTDFVSCTYIPESDHTMTRLASQARFISSIEDWVVDLDRSCREDAVGAGVPTQTPI